MTAGSIHWRLVIVVAAVGLAVGALSFLAQGWLSGDWSYLGNSGVVWLVPAFFMGALARSQRRAAVAGLGTLAGCLAGYFIAGTLWGVPYARLIILYWAGVAIVVGPLLGLAGRWWRDARQWRRAVALALLGGVFVAEGIYTLLVNSHLSVGWPLIGAGMLVPLLLGRSARPVVWADGAGTYVRAGRHGLSTADLD
jgi:hypothetical protein